MSDKPDDPSLMKMTIMADRNKVTLLFDAVWARIGEVLAESDLSHVDVLMGVHNVYVQTIKRCTEVYGPENAKHVRNGLLNSIKEDLEK